MQRGLMGTLKTKNISQVITERIVSGILSGEIQPGDRLPTEDEFAARIGVGKGSVREAIKVLEAMGVVEIRRADGTYVAQSFRGAMLDPLLYGILLSERNDADVADFFVRVQRLVAEAIMDEGPAGDVAAVRSLLEDHLDERVWPGAGAEAELLREVGERLGASVANPLVGELAHQAAKIASYQLLVTLERLEAAGDGWLLTTLYRDLAVALCAQDRARVAEALGAVRAVLGGARA